MATRFDELPALDRLRSILDSALAALEEAPGHDLSLAWRETVWAAMGSRGSRGEGHRRRSLLAIRAAERILPFWSQNPSDEMTPHQALADAESALDDSTQAESFSVFKSGVGTRVDQYWFHFLGLVSVVPPLDPLVGFAATRALGTVLGDERFRDDPTLTIVATDDAEEPQEVEDIDAAAWASRVEAGGSTRNPASDPAKRLAFWEWYLIEAVPAAYRDGSLPPRPEGDS